MVRAPQRMRERYCAFGVRCATAVLSLLTLFPSQATAQGVRGEIFDEESGESVVTAQVALVDATGKVVGRALSDSAGSFYIEVGLGTYSLVVNRLGYDPRYVMEVAITDTSIAQLEVRLSPDAILLPGLEVEGERGVRHLTTNGFYWRQKKGFGDFIEVEDLDRIQTQEPTQLLRSMPGIKTQRGEVFTRRGDAVGNACLLQVVVDNVYLGVNLDDILIVEEIEAIEVYNGINRTPSRWKTLAGRGYFDNAGTYRSTCGVVVVWTRR
ncbi:MAG: carboxypeptidase-like regulatory domain-containing protein [Longimicrobiales bacterium]